MTTEITKIPHTEIAELIVSALNLDVAPATIVPDDPLFGDVLGLGSDARMNTPGRAEGNWAWRFRGGALSDELGRRLHETTKIYGRLP